MPPKIPDRWLDYTPVGQIIKGTRFIAFKVPLRNDVVESVPPELQLSISSLLNKIPDLGMIIDLTNTNRYYDPTFFQKKGLEYNKLMIPGREIPPQNCIERFNRTVKNYLQENANNSKLIGVHCTHGVNRTGYLISSFMISELKMDPKEAIKCVEEARGHAIERVNYRNHLTGDTSLLPDESKLNHNNFKHRYPKPSRGNFNNFQQRDNNTNWRNHNNFQQRDSYDPQDSYYQHSTSSSYPSRSDRPNNSYSNKKGGEYSYHLNRYGRNNQSNYDE